MIRVVFIKPVLVLSLLLGGCADTALFRAGAAPQPAPPAKTLTVMGYGTVSRDQQFRLTPAQRRLMAMRASKMDAMRALAEQVYGVRIQASTTVEEMAVKNDHYRAFVDSFLRGARVVRSTTLDADSYQTEMALELTPVFYQCASDARRCQLEVRLGQAPAKAVAEPLVGEKTVDARCDGQNCHDYPKTQGFSDVYTVSRY